MASRLELHGKLLEFVSNAYFQPPSDIQLVYPCIIYNKTDKFKEFSNNGIYITLQEYNLTVIDEDPDSLIADDIESGLQYCSINQYYTADELNHITLTLYY